MTAGPGLHYLGIAPVKVDARGEATFRRSDLRFAPEFGRAPRQEETMEPGYDYEYWEIPGGTDAGDDPTGLSYIPESEGWMDRWAWTSDEFTTDTENSADGDVDVYDSMHQPDEYNSMVAGSEFGALQRQSAESKWQKTVLAANTNLVTSVATGAVVNFQQTLTIRPQFDFVAQDVTFDPNVALGSSSGVTGITLNFANVTSILFGDHVVYQNAIGTPIQIFSSSAAAGGASFVRGIVKGAKIRGGLDISVTINWNVTGGGAATPNDIQITSVFVGLKPQRTCL